MNCSEEFNCPTPESEATIIVGRMYCQTDYFVIEEIRGHRRDSTSPTLFKLRVRWEGGEETWEPETDLQIDAPLALFAYWDSLWGGRASAMVDKELWHVFKVVSHETKPDGNVYLQVAWVGSPDTSWEPEGNIRKAAGRLVENYWRSVGGRSGTMTRPDEAESFVEDATGVTNKRRKLV
ncbi:uncharacterized protein ColSpa_12779 [Colletotrichum spaethianum]|uniref:Chromo domain-containing protein n=1 Tax=Colletotrichum spaethianum TaxID=700344 RepID=A0AA37PHT5_9PEZI|nr:uncharacterized protein ColSpa_12779 [Colletotrichum spaethianum]GKT52598.1 hypothetical protein ColSpa_12779 [Colletotrichum spaethianum]